MVRVHEQGKPLQLLGDPATVAHKMQKGTSTVFTYRVEMVPDFWLPSLLGPSLLRHEMAEQFSALVAEMQRRSTPR